MDISDRSTYTSSLQILSAKPVGVEGPAHLRGEQPSATSATDSNAETDSTELSPAAYAVAHTMQLPEVRQDRVADLQQQIASGSYHVAAQDVADAMLRNLAS